MQAVVNYMFNRKAITEENAFFNYRITWIGKAVAFWILCVVLQFSDQGTNWWATDVKGLLWWVCLVCAGHGLVMVVAIWWL